MKIGFCRLFESSWGGGETQASLLSAGLSSSGFDILDFNAFVSHPVSKKSSAFFRATFDISRKPLIEDFFHNLEIFYHTMRIHRFIKEKRIDIVHFHYANFIPISWFLRQVDNLPVVVSLHWVPLDYPLELAAKLWHSSFFRSHQFIAFDFGLKNASRVISPSKYYADLVERNCGIRPLVIPNPIQVNDYNRIPKETARRYLGFTDNDFVILCAGRIDPQKGIKYLIEGFAEITHQNPSAKLILVGDGPERIILEELVKKKHLKNIVFTGFISRNQLILLLSASDLYVSPTLYESFGISVLEALASGLPIVCSNIMSLPEIVEDGKNGFLVPPSDSRAISEEISKIMFDKSLQDKFRVNNRQKAMLFSIESILPKFIKIYSDLMIK